MQGLQTKSLTEKIELQIVMGNSFLISKHKPNPNTDALQNSSADQICFPPHMMHVSTSIKAQHLKKFVFAKMLEHTRNKLRESIASQGLNRPNKNFFHRHAMPKINFNQIKLYVYCQQGQQWWFEDDQRI